MLESAAQKADSRFADLPDSRLWFERVFGRKWAVVFAALTVAVIARASVFGDANLHPDEAFYFLVGQRMQAGDLLYVDIWDRKPPGLFLLYRVFASITHDFWIVHLAAGLSAVGTALLIYRISLGLANRQGAVLAGLTYLCLLPLFGGAGGQSPVFYNLLMAAAAWLILRGAAMEGRSRLVSELCAMVCAGLALTIKPTAMFEGIFMGMWVLWSYHRQKMPARQLALRVVILAVIGALPTLCYFAWYLQAGYFEIMWQSVVVSNFARKYDPAGNNAFHTALLFVQTSLPLAAALLSVVTARQRLRRDPDFLFVSLWTVVAIGAFLAFPDKFDHYVLPTLLPLSILGAVFYGRKDFGLVFALILAVAFLKAGNCFAYQYHQRSIKELDAVAAMISHKANRTPLFVYGKGVFLYAMSDAKPPAVLAFPTHLIVREERDVSPYSTESQMRLALSKRPATVVAQASLPGAIANNDLTSMLNDYVRSCGSSVKMPLRDKYKRHEVLVFSNCGNDNEQGMPSRELTPRAVPRPAA